LSSSKEYINSQEENKNTIFELGKKRSETFFSSKPRLEDERSFAQERISTNFNGKDISMGYYEKKMEQMHIDRTEKNLHDSCGNSYQIRDTKELEYSPSFRLGNSSPHYDSRSGESPRKLNDPILKDAITFASPIYVHSNGGKFWDERLVNPSNNALIDSPLLNQYKKRAAVPFASEIFDRSERIISPEKLYSITNGVLDVFSPSKKFNSPPPYPLEVRRSNNKFPYSESNSNLNNNASQIQNNRRSLSNPPKL
jgi:hypothetical protein